MSLWLSAMSAKCYKKGLGMNRLKRINYSWQLHEWNVCRCFLQLGVSQFMRIYCWPSEVCGAISPKASGVVFASEWVGAGGFFLGGAASIPCWMAKSAAQQKCIPRWGRAAWVPRLSGSLAGLRLWLNCSLMAGKEGRVYRWLVVKGPNQRKMF